MSWQNWIGAPEGWGLGKRVFHYFRSGISLCPDFLYRVNSINQVEWRDENDPTGRCKRCFALRRTELRRTELKRAAK